MRRKSLASVLLPSDINSKSSDLKRRKSIASMQVSKSVKKRKASVNSLDSFEIISSNVQGKNQQIKPSMEVLQTPKTAVKSTNEPSAISQNKKKNKIKLNHSTPLVLAPGREDNKSSSLNVRSKSSKRSSKIERKQKLEDDPSEIKANIESFEQFKIKFENVENAVKGVIKFAQNNPHLQNQLFNEEVPLFLQINSFKIPKTKGPVKQLFRVPLRHSILPSDADVCLIVPDVKGIKNNEHEKHLEHYENLLRSKDVTEIKKIMTYHEFRTEYDTFELKHRLVDLYDAFLVDGRISGKVVNKCGNIFYNKRKVPIAIKLYIPKLKSHIEQALKKAFINLNVKSDSHIVQIGHSKINTNDLVENVYSVITFLDQQFPGKMDNIRSLNIYAHRGSSIPIYISLKNPNDVKVPTLLNKKPKAYKAVRGELTTKYNADVVVKPSGHVIIKKSKGGQKNKDPNDNITDAKILKENMVVNQTEQQNGDGKVKSKKRKLSELGKDGQITKEISSVQSEGVGPKKKKTKKSLRNIAVKQENANQDVEQSKVDKKHKKKKGNEYEKIEENDTADVMTHQDVEHSKVDKKHKNKKDNEYEKIKENGTTDVIVQHTLKKDKKVIKNKIKKKTSVAK